MGIKITLIFAMMLLNQSSVKAKTIGEDYTTYFESAQDLEAIKTSRLEKFIERKRKEARQTKKEAQEKKTQAKEVLIVETKEVVIEKPIINNFEALVQATWRLETGNGTSSLWLTQNNAGGIKCGSTYCRYPTEQAGLEALKTLLARYVEKYGYDLEAIRSIYSESNDTDLFRQIYLEEGGQ